MQLSSETHGDTSNPTIVFLHGLTGNRRTFDQVIPQFLDDYFVVTADLRGHGRSPHASSYRAAEYASDVAELITELDRGPVTLIGHSLGGITALAVASAHPELTRALFLEDPPVFEGDAEVRKTSPAAMFFKQYVKQIRQWQASGASVDEVAEQVGAQPAIQGMTRVERTGAEAVRSVAVGLLRMDPSTLDSAINGQTWEGYDPLASVACPVTLLRADPAAGAVFTAENEPTFLSAVPHANVLMAEGKGHGIHSDRDGRGIYLRALTDFLTSL